MKTKAAVVIVAMAFSFALSGCQKEPEPAPGQSGKLTATADYIKHFGPPAAADQGTAYAFVVYFASFKHPGKVTPFPFTIFNEPSRQKVALELLIGGMEVGSYRG